MSIGRGFAGDDVIEVANRKTFHFHPATPGIFEALDSVRSKDKVEIEWPILKLDEILPALDFDALLIRKSEP